jgi:biopolymer transport protein ExbD
MIEFLRPRKSALSLDMAPLIDVVFQLLIFFMLTTSFSNPSLRLNLPKAVIHDRPEPERIVLSIDRGGRILVNSERTGLDELEGVLASRLAGDSAKSVHVRGDAEMPYRLFVEVMDLARRAGARQINIVHDPSGEKA